MSVIVTTLVAVPIGTSVAGGFLASAAAAAAAVLGLRLADETAAETELENSVDLCVNNAEEVAVAAGAGKSLTFVGNGVRVEFFNDANGQAAVRVSGKGNEESLREIGDAFAKKIVQRYAYHRLVTEMRARNMNIVEDEVEEDGTVRMRVRVLQG